MNDSSGEKVASGIGWTFAERILAQGVSFIVSIILARHLLPEEYGIISIVLIFINIANVFVTNGLGEALVQRKHIDEVEYSTIFWISLGLSLVLSAGLFFAAPFIAEDYQIPELKAALRVLLIKIILSAVNTIQHAYVSQKMIFRKFFFATLGGTLVSAVVGILLVYKGFGIWALVAQYLTNSFIDTIILQLSIDWKPRFVFSKKAAKELVSYGSKLTLSALIIVVYDELRSLIIGKKYSTEDLAYYNKGNQFPSVLINNFNIAIGKVFFPMMVTLNNNTAELKKFTKKTMKISSYIVFPILVCMIVTAKPVVTIVLTEKWLACVPYMRIMCVFWMTQPLQTANWQVIKAVGRSDLCVKLEVVKKIVGLILLFSTMSISVEALAWSYVLFAVISMFVNMFPLRKLIKYSIGEQIVDVLPILAISVVAGLVSYSLGFIKTFDVIKVILQVAVGGIVFFALSKWFCKDCLDDVIRLIKSYITKNLQLRNKK